MVAAATGGIGPAFLVMVTNLTTGQTFTPMLAANHRSNVNLFTLGQPASQELEVLAEDGASAPLRSVPTRNPAVGDVTVRERHRCLAASP